MKKIVLTFLLTFSFTFSVSFINPINFNNNRAGQKKVNDWVKTRTKEQMDVIGAGSPAYVKMMVRENLNAFKELLRVKDKALLAKIIKENRAVGADDYSSILLMYNQQKR